MTHLYPGALWRPQTGQERRGARRKGRGVGLHIAVSEAASIHGINERTGNDAHLYVRRDGGVEQNVDLDLIAYAGAAGNGSMLWVETQGGTTPADVKAGRWDPPQAEALAQVLAYAHRTEGTPLELMPDSRPASRGLAGHRLGVQHSRGIGAVPGFLVAGGERWSSSVGKECPGDARVGQLGELVARARAIVGGAAPLPARPAPAPPAGRPLVKPWPLPAGHWLGNVNGPAKQHGGHPRYDSAVIRDVIGWVQRWLIFRDCVAGVPASAWATSSWADGLWEDATDRAVIEWHRRYYPGQPQPAQIWADDYRRLTA